MSNLRQRRTSSRVVGPRRLFKSGADKLAGRERQGLFLDFTTRSVKVMDDTTAANRINSLTTSGLETVDPITSLLTYTSPSLKMTAGPNAGQLRFGAHNLCLRTDSTTNWTAYGGGAPTLTYGSAGPFGGSTAFELTTDGVDRGIYQAGGGTWASGNNDGSVWLRATTGTVAGYIYAQGDNNTGRASFSVGTTWTQVSGATAPAGTSVFFILQLNVAGTIQFCRPHLRRTPSDSTYLSTTTASRISLPLQWTSAGVLEGILLEEARTNLCLYSDDLTNAAWVKTTMNTAKTATGPDGVANSATTITATAGNATILQSITSASAARVTSCYIKRRTGTGTVEMTQDNGATWAAVTVTAGWTRVNIAAATLTNPIVGLRVVTNTDAVDVALFDHEVGSFITSPIPTVASTVTRAADSGITLATSAYPHSATVNSGWIEYVPANVAAAMVALRWDDGTANEVVSVGHSAAAALGLTVTDGGAAQTAPLTSGTATAAATERVAFSWKANDFLFSDNGAAAVADTSGTLPTVTSLDFGPTLTGVIKRIVVVPVEKDAAEVATMATA